MDEIWGNTNLIALAWIAVPVILIGASFYTYVHEKKKWVITWISTVVAATTATYKYQDEILLYLGKTQPEKVAISASISPPTVPIFPSNKVAIKKPVIKKIKLPKVIPPIVQAKETSKRESESRKVGLIIANRDCKTASIFLGNSQFKFPELQYWHEKICLTEQRKIAQQRNERRSMITAIQTQLIRLGCYSDAKSGVWNKITRSAIDKAAFGSGLNLNAREPNDKTLLKLQKVKRKVCFG